MVVLWRFCVLLPYKKWKEDLTQEIICAEIQWVIVDSPWLICFFTSFLWFITLNINKQTEKKNLIWQSYFHEYMVEKQIIYYYMKNRKCRNLSQESTNDIEWTTVISKLSQPQWTYREHLSELHDNNILHKAMHKDVSHSSSQRYYDHRCNRYTQKSWIRVNKFPQNRFLSRRWPSLRRH